MIVDNLSIQFIEKRIEEQNDEITKIVNRFSKKEIDFVRFRELYNSAHSQLMYFLNKHDEYATISSNNVCVFINRFVIPFNEI